MSFRPQYALTNPSRTKKTRLLRDLRNLRLYLNQTNPGGSRGATTKAITDRLVEWAAVCGRACELESTLEGFSLDGKGGILDARISGLDGVLAIELDRSNKQRSIEKLAWCAEQGMLPVWIVWNHAEISPCPEDIHIVALDVTTRWSPATATGAKSRWTPEEESALEGAYGCGRTIDQLAETHQRTELAIASRLVRLGHVSLGELPKHLRVALDD